MTKENIITEKTFSFALSIIILYKQLVEEKEYILSKQLLKSATSIWANIEEASAAQTKKDFIAKMSISSKEARETRYRLRILQESELTSLDISSYLNDIEHIINIITKIIKTTQTNLNK